MTERVVVLNPADPFAFVADACGALAAAVNEVRPWSPSDTGLVDVYAEMVVAYANLVRPLIAESSSATARLAIIDHLVDRLRQAQAGDVEVRVADVVDRLHGELTREPLPA